MESAHFSEIVRMDKLVDRLHDDHAWQHSNVCQNPHFGSDDDSQKKAGKASYFSYLRR